MNENIEVLFIGGYSRSGSTLLLRLLGLVEGSYPVGELWDIWDRSFVQNQLCGCGQPFRSCEFWQAVIHEAFGGLDRVDVAEMQRLRQMVQGRSRLPQLLVPALRSSSYQSSLTTYVAVLYQWYRAIQKISGCGRIVDSSKVPHYAFLLHETPGIALRVLHLVRDSRATAHSWQRKKQRPEIYWTTSYMEQYSPLHSAVEWAFMNGLLQTLQGRGVSYLRVRYEDVASHPRSALEQISRWMGVEAPAFGQLDQNYTHLGINHTVSGNPNRFQQGAIRIKPDEEWRHKMPRRQQRVVAAFTWPLLLQYGYWGREAAIPPAPTPTGAAVPDERFEQISPSPIGAGVLAGCSNRPEDATVKPDQPLRVLYVTPRYLPLVGGTEVHTYEMARRLAENGQQVTVLTTDPIGNLPEYEFQDGIHVRRVAAWPRLSDYHFAPRIYQTIQQGEWDLIHCQGSHTFVAPLTMLAALRARIPYVVTFHSGGHSSRVRTALRGTQWRLLRPLLARADRLISVSSFEATFFQQYLGLPPQRFTVIPNGAQLPDPERETVADASPLILSIGRLERYKGHHRVIAALPHVARHYPNIRLLIVGTGSYEQALRRLAAQHGVRDRVEIRSVAGSNRAEMARLLLRAKLTILLSDYESQGIAVMEALALGRPVLVADSSALRELAENGLVRATPLGSTAEEVAQDIVHQLRYPLVPPEVALPTWDQCYEALLGIYRSITARTLCAS